MKVAVCEDVLQEAQWLCETIRKWFERRRIYAEVASFADAEAFLFALEDTHFDMLFLDIKMPGEDGVSLARRLRKAKLDVAIVFVTGEKEYVMEGYEVEAVHYLLKPVEEEKVFLCLQRIYEKEARQEPYLILDTESGKIKLLQREIYQLEVFGHSLQYITRKGSFEVAKPLKQALAELETGSFVLCYRGIAVNLLYVDAIEKNKLSLRDEKEGFAREIPVSRRLYHNVNEAFIQYYKK